MVILLPTPPVQNNCPPPFHPHSVCEQAQVSDSHSCQEPLGAGGWGEAQRSRRQQFGVGVGGPEPRTREPLESQAQSGQLPEYSGARPLVSNDGLVTQEKHGLSSSDLGHAPCLIWRSHPLTGRAAGTLRLTTPSLHRAHGSDFKAMIMLETCRGSLNNGIFFPEQHYSPH